MVSTLSRRRGRGCLPRPPAAGSGRGRGRRTCAWAVCIRFPELGCGRRCCDGCGGGAAANKASPDRRVESAGAAGAFCPSASPSMRWWLWHRCEAAGSVQAVDACCSALPFLDLDLASKAMGYPAGALVLLLRDRSSKTAQLSASTRCGWLRRGGARTMPRLQLVPAAGLRTWV